MSKNMKAFAQARQAQDDADIEAYEKSILEAQEEQEVENEPARGVSEENWKKRHGDTRRHLAKREREWAAREQELLQKIEQAQNSTSQQAPVTEEELKQYVQQYPKVGALIGRMVQQQVADQLRGAETKLSKIDDLQDELSREKASKLLHKLQPKAFGDEDGKLPNGEYSIFGSDEFWTWLSEQDLETNRVIEEGIDARKASLILNAWKGESGYTGEPAKKTKRKSQSTADAASSVRTTGGPTVSDQPKGDYDFTESEIDKMSNREYDAREAEIDAARVAGRILYDMSS